jgi:hypothetical protein
MDFRQRAALGLPADEHGRIYARAPLMPKVKGPTDTDAEYIATSEYLPVVHALDANLVTSLTESGEHRPLLDLDFPCRLIESQTPGHYHLYLDGVKVSHEHWKNVLRALAQAGIVQERWADNMRLNGAVALRHG